MNLGILFICIMISTVSEGKMKAPFLPPRTGASTPPVAPMTLTQRQQKPLRSERSALGFEAGILGVANKTSSEFLGLQLMYGMRSHYIFPLSKHFFLRPSLGYFMKPQSEGEVSITQHLIEGGLGIHYAFGRSTHSLWHLGLVQRMDYLFSRIAVKESAASTPASFRYRTSGSLGTRLKLSEHSDLSFDFEAGVAPFEKTRLQSSFTTGFIFFID